MGLLSIKFFMEYKRDKRSPTPKNENVSKVMSANKAKNTKPELLLRKKLWEASFRGHRINYKKISGKPDIAFPSKKIAIFIHGCYWHRCPHCNLSLPKTNIDFWKTKFEKNTIRDKIKTKDLIDEGWLVFTFWECQVKTDLDRIIKLFRQFFKKKKTLPKEVIL